MMEKKCPECGAGNPASEDMCDHCGFSLDGTAAVDSPKPAGGEACPDCGKQVGTHMRFCDGCGAALGFGVPDGEGRLTAPAAPPPTFAHTPPLPSDPDASTPPVPPVPPVSYTAAVAACEPPAGTMADAAPSGEPAATTLTTPTPPAAPSVPTPPAAPAAVATPTPPAAPAAGASDSAPGPRADAWKLTCVEGFHIGKEYLIYKDDMLLGRTDTEADIYPELGLEDQDDGFVSRRHARLRRSDGRITVEDLGGENGTQIDGRPLPAFKPTPLGAGQVLRVGKVGLMLQVHSAA